MPVTRIRTKWSSGSLIFYPDTDDTGAINIGDGTTDCDFKIFLGSTTEYMEFDVGNSRTNIYGAPLYVDGFSGTAGTSALIQFAGSNGVLVSDSISGASGSASGYVAIKIGANTRYIYTYSATPGSA